MLSAFSRFSNLKASASVSNVLTTAGSVRSAVPPLRVETSAIGSAPASCNLLISSTPSIK